MKKKAQTAFAKKAPTPEQLGWQLLLEVRKGYEAKTERVKELLANGATPDIQDTSGRDALSYSCIVWPAHHDIVRLLLSAGAKATKKEPSAFGGCTHLHCAAARGDVDLARMLLDAGADPDAKDSRGSTPLMDLIVACNGSIDTAQLLLERGASIAASDTRGDTVLSLVARFNHKFDYKLEEILHQEQRRRDGLETDRLFREGLPYDIPAMKPIHFIKKKLSFSTSPA